MTYKKRRLMKYILRNSPGKTNSFLQVAEKITFYAKILLSWYRVSGRKNLLAAEILQRG
jgi:hypothetical protein